MPKVSVTIITLNEAAHIGAAIDSVAWADEILVIDSGSTDATTEIARAKGATVIHRDWPGWVDQKNFAADRAANHWIFSLDADERVPAPLERAISFVASVLPQSTTSTSSAHDTLSIAAPMWAASLRVMMVTEHFGIVCARSGLRRDASYLSGASCTVSKSTIERW